MTRLLRMLEWLTPRITRLLGHEPDALSRVTTGAPPSMWLLLIACVCSSSAVSVAMGGALVYGGLPWWEVAPLATLAGLLQFNLLRLVHANGMAPDLTPDEARAWRPSTAPLFIFLALAAPLSQGALLALHGKEGDASVAFTREQLFRLQKHARIEPLQRQVADIDRELAAQDVMSARLGADDDDAPMRAALRARALQIEARRRALLEEWQRRERAELEVFRRHLATVDFPVQRLDAIWARRERALLVSALFALCMCSPILLRLVEGRRLVSYELQRRRLYRAKIKTAESFTSQQLSTLASEAVLPRMLSAKRTRLRPPNLRSLYADPPFDNVLLSDEQSQLVRVEAISADALFSELAKSRPRRS